MDKLQCRHCLHFRQHYIFDGKDYREVYCGHCIKARVKAKRPDRAACEDFTPADPSQLRLTTPHRIAEDLLRYILRMQVSKEFITETLSRL